MFYMGLQIHCRKSAPIEYRVFCSVGGHGALLHAILPHAPNISPLCTGCGVRAAMTSTVSCFPALVHSGAVWG